jgi:hypothetical protein
VGKRGLGEVRSQGGQRDAPVLCAFGTQAQRAGVLAQQGVLELEMSVLLGWEYSLAGVWSLSRLRSSSRRKWHGCQLCSLWHASTQQVIHVARSESQPSRAPWQTVT